MAAGINVSVEENLRSAVARLESRSKGVIAKSAARALNRAATSVRSAAVKEIRKRYLIKPAALRKQIKIVKARASRLTAEVVATGRRIPLFAFSARKVRGGVSVNVTGSRKIVRGVFLATMPDGRRGVFERTGEFGRRGNPRLEKIAELFSLSITQAFRQRSILRALRRVASTRFIAEFEREIRFRSGG